jgi:hypothetical protein
VDFDRNEISEVVWEVALDWLPAIWVADQAHAEAMAAVDTLLAMSDPTSKELAEAAVAALGSHA